jgi:DNA-binding GntR family transcriptional regulator
MSVGADHRTLRELVADAILERILRGDLAPGARLYEDKLAAELGVSRNPVRESIRALEATGLIEVVPRKGAYVVEIDRSDLVHLLGVRSVLEAYAA